MTRCEKLMNKAMNLLATLDMANANDAAMVNNLVVKLKFSDADAAYTVRNFRAMYSRNASR